MKLNIKWGNAMILLAIINTIIIIIMLCLAGCTKTAIKRTDDYLAFTHYEFLMKSDMTNAEAVIDGEYRHYSVGSRSQSPDPNGIRAIVEGVVEGML